MEADTYNNIGSPFGRNTGRNNNPTLQEVEIRNSTIERSLTLSEDFVLTATIVSGNLMLSWNNNKEDSSYELLRKEDEDNYQAILDATN